MSQCLIGKGTNMYVCECSREFTTFRGLIYHKKFCGINKISYDSGYQTRIDEHGRLIYIHREILEKKIGRKLKRNEVAHHIDGNKLNNVQDNLEVMTRSYHGKHHIENKSEVEFNEWCNKIMTTKIINDSQVRGINCKGAKLNEEKVKYIRIELKNGRSYKELSEVYNVHPFTIEDIDKKRSWKHIK